MIALVVLVATAFFPRSPIVETLTGEAVGDSELVFPLGYVLTSPMSSFFDHLTLVTDRQHLAILITWVVLFLVWRGWRNVAGANRGRGPVRATLREGLVAVGSLAALLAVYAFGVLGARPMSALRALDPEVAIVDFHSHTEASHDGRAGLDIQARRRWNGGAGFDIAYVTDHSRTGEEIRTALDGMAGNPVRAGDGLSLLPGRELVYERQHVIVLGRADPVAGVPEDEPWPILIQTLPNDLSRVPIGTSDGRNGVHAIELMDGDPRGFRQSVEERDLVLALMDSLDLVPIAASNHHGWGMASAAWTLMRLPGWRDQSPEEVGARIEARIREGGADTRVVERPRLAGGTADEGAFMAATTFPRFWWHVLTGLTVAERIVWLLWIAALAAGASRWAASRRSRSSLVSVESV